MKKLGYGIEVGATLGGSFRSTMGQARQGIGGVGKAVAAQERGLKRAGHTARNTARETDRLDRSSSRLGRTVRRGREEMARAARGVAAYGRAMSRATLQSRKLHRVGALAGKGLDMAATRYAALAGTIGVGASVRQVGNLQERFVRLGIASNAREEMEDLKARIFKAATADGIRVSASEITSAVEKIVEMTGDLDLARDNLENIALAIQASGAAGQDIGALVANNRDKFGIRDANDMLTALDELVLQGKSGAFTLENFATQGERLTAAYAAFGRTGRPALKELGGFIQSVKQGVGSAEAAATAFESLLTELVQKSDKIEALGVDVFDPDRYAETGERVGRAIDDIVRDLIEAADGDVKVLGEIFGAQSIRALTAAMTEFREQRKFATLDTVMKVEGDGAALKEDAADAAGTLNQAMSALGDSWTRFADKRLGGAVNWLATQINTLGANGADTVFSIGTAVAGLGAAAIAGRKVFRMFGLGKSKAAGGVASGAAAAAGGLAGGVQPVYVVNMPPGGFGAMGGGKGRAGRGVARGGRLGGLMRGGGKLLGRAALPLALGMGVLGMSSAARAGDAQGVGRAGGGLAGALGGAAAGAALGSVVPIMGTTIGGILGGVIGGFGGEWLGGKIGKAVGGTPEAEVAAAPAATVTASSGPKAQAALRPIQLTQHWTVHAAPGMDEEALARRIEKRIEAATRRALHD